MLAQGISEEATAKPRVVDIDLIPQDALVACVIRDPQDTFRKMASLARRTQGQVSGLFNFATTYGPMLLRDSTHMRGSFDMSGPAALVYFDSWEDVALLLPHTGVEKVAEAFNVGANGLKSGVIDCPKDFGFLLNEPSMAIHGGHVVLGPKETVEKILRSDGLGTHLRPETAEHFAYDDCVITCNLSAIQEMDGNGRVPDFPIGDWRELAADGELKRFTAGLRIGEEGEAIRDGFDISVVVEFDGRQSKELLTRLQNESRPSNLQGLARGKIVLAGARSNGPDCGEQLFGILEELTPWFFKDLKYNELSPRLTSFIESIGKQAFQRVQSSRIALYQTEQPEQLGSFALVAILDVEDTNGFMQDIQDLTPLFDAALYPEQDAELEIDPVLLKKMLSFLDHENQRAREFMEAKLRVLGRRVLPELRALATSENEKRRGAALRLIRLIEQDMLKENAEFLTGLTASGFEPHLSFVPQYATEGKVPVSAIQLSFDTADEKVARQLISQLGPDWNKIRIAKLEEQIVVMVGSDSKLFAETLKNLRSGKDGIDGLEHYRAFRDSVPEALMSEMHFSLSAAQLIAWAFQRGNRRNELQFLPSGETPCSLGLSIGTQHVQLDLFVPTVELNRLQDLW